eukprot:5606365-Prymnesium_polylepis.1
MLDIDTNTLIAVGTLVASTGGGVALIAFTENAGVHRQHRSTAVQCLVLRHMRCGPQIIGLLPHAARRRRTGKRNEESANAQVCVECTGAKVVTCTICQGSGSDPYASLVAGVREMAGGDSMDGKVVVE